MGVFCAGTSPQGALHAGALGDQLLPAGAPENFAEMRVGHLGVRNCNRTLKFILVDLLERLVDGRIHPADEEGSDGGDPAGVAVCCHQLHQAGDVGLGHGLILS